MALTSGLAWALAGRVQAGEIRLGGVLPGGALIRKKVVSMREAKFTDLVAQKLDFSCGAAVVATILTYAYGIETTEQAALSEMLAISDREKVFTLGFSLLDMKNYVQSLGFRAEGLRVDTENLHMIEVPTIVLVNIRGYRHFVVLRKTQDGNVYLGDPALGNHVRTISEFTDIWNGIVFAIVGESYNLNNVLLTPPQPLSARRLLALRAPVVDADVFDFGIANANMF